MKKNGCFPLIALEGLDLVGKTTCALALTEKIGGIYYKMPPNPWRGIKERVDALDDVNYRFLFYLGSGFYASKELGEIVKTRAVICDRSVYTFFAYHEALGCVTGVNIDELGLLLPDICFLLTASDDACKKRSKNRSNKSVIDRAMEGDPRLKNEVLNQYLKYPMIRIDTSSITVEQVCQKIISHVY